MSKPKKQPTPKAEAAQSESAVAKLEAPKAKTPRLSDSLKAEADRIIAKRDKKAAPKEKRELQEDLVVFAFRLSPEEREAIHKAAGPAKASRFVRTLAVAAAKRDQKAVNELIAGIT